MGGPRRKRVRPRSRRSCASLRKIDAGMPTFAYRAADRQGQTVDGVMEAPDVRGVVERLQRDAYFPIRVAPQDERRSGLRIALPRRGRITRREVLTLTHQLGPLVEAGLPLDRA